MLYITHNLGVVSRIADRVCVLYAGHVVETGGKSHDPRPSRASLHQGPAGLSAVARRHRSRGEAVGHRRGNFPISTRPVPGCVFAARCPFAEERCRTERQEIVEADGRRLRCWKASALADTPWPGTKPAAASTRRLRPYRRGSREPRRRRPDQDLLRARGLAAAIEWTRSWAGLPWLRWRRRALRAVDDVSLTIGAGRGAGPGRARAAAARPRSGG